MTEFRRNNTVHDGNVEDNFIIYATTAVCKKSEIIHVIQKERKNGESTIGSPRKNISNLPNMIFTTALFSKPLSASVFGNSVSLGLTLRAAQPCNLNCFLYQQKLLWTAPFVERTVYILERYHMKQINNGGMDDSINSLQDTFVWRDHHHHHGKLSCTTLHLPNQEHPYRVFVHHWNDT